MKQFNKQKFILIIVFPLLFSCIKTTPQNWDSGYSNIDELELNSKPVSKIYSLPNQQIETLKTFSVFPISILSKEQTMNEIEEKQVLFFLRNLIESKGYKFVPLDSNPDFLATISISSKYEEDYVPTKIETKPVYIPGSTVTSHTNATGAFNYGTIGNYSYRGWGNYIGSSSTTTQLPGTISTTINVTPGYTVGEYFVQTEISIFETKRRERIWLGLGVGSSNNFDARISSQFVALNLFSDFPSKLEVPLNERVGYTFNLLTIDGNNYCPIITALPDNSAFSKAGVELYDMILSVNGESVTNKPVSELLEIFKKTSNQVVAINVKRLNKKILLNVPKL